MMKIKSLISFGGEMGVMILLILIVGNIRYENGRINMCQDLGYVMGWNGKETVCVTCQEANMKYFEGKCIQKDKNDPIIGYSISDENSLMNFKENGSILQFE